MRERTSHIFSKHTCCRVAVAFLLACALIPCAAYAEPTISELQAQADSAYADLCAMEVQLDEASNAYFLALEELQKAQDRIAELQGQIDEATSRIAIVQGKLSARARSMYRSDQIGIIDVVLGSSSFMEFANKLSLLDQMNQKDANMVEEAKTLKAQLEAQKAELAEQERAAAEAAEQARIVQKEAELVYASMQDLYQSLSDEVASMVEAERAAAEARDAAAFEESGGGQDGDYTDPYYDAAWASEVLDRAYSYLGEASYVWGSCAPGEFDCSGFVSYCLSGRYSRLGTTYTFLTWPEVHDPQPGDVAVNTVHCGIYIGGGQIIHCTSSADNVIIGPVQSGMTFHRWC
ncbi:MAG: hydrolase Nlp/P60 [Eggerthellaceae bacterium]|nr:hydrolase Nlp/P60 [Eggerthellaceae bacterium]